MKRINTISHKGATILHLDFSNTSDDDVVNTIAEAKPVIAKYSPKTALILTDLTNIPSETRTNNAFKDFVAHNKPYIKASAVVGLSTFKRIIFNSVLKLTGRSITLFEKTDEAKDWLAKQG